MRRYFITLANFSTAIHHREAMTKNKNIYENANNTKNHRKKYNDFYRLIDLRCVVFSGQNFILTAFTSFRTGNSTTIHQIQGNSYIFKAIFSVDSSNYVAKI